MIKTIDEINELFVILTYKLFDMDPQADTDGFVRLAYQEDSQPFQNIKQDVIYLFVNEVDDPANKVIERIYNPETPNHISVLNVQWTAYGPNAYSNAKKIKLHLAYQDIGWWLRQQNIGRVRDMADPIYLPEKIDNRYWRRSDVSAEFYINVFDSQEDYDIGSADITLLDDTHIRRTITIKPRTVTK